MNDQLLRLECLRLAAAHASSGDFETIVKDAAQFYAFAQNDCGENYNYNAIFGQRVGAQTSVPGVKRA
jgi:hypothetical protein